MTQTAKDYAAALFALAKEQHAEKAFSDALTMTTALWKENPEYVEFLASPAIPKKERVAAMEAAFSGAVPDELLAFFSLLIENGRVRELNECANEFEAMREFAEKISTAEVTSAVDLTEEEKEALMQKLAQMSGHTVRLVCHTDASLIGGMVVRIDGKVLDGSIKHRLREVKEVIR